MAWCLQGPSQRSILLRTNKVDTLTHASGPGTRIPTPRWLLLVGSTLLVGHCRPWCKQDSELCAGGAYAGAPQP